MKMMNINQDVYLGKSQFKARILFLIALTVLYLTLFLFQDKLQFPLKWDEGNFWDISQSFSRSIIPTWKQLKSYNSPTTPLPFLLFGWLEHFFQRGIFVGRLFNFILSFILLCLVGLPRANCIRTPILSSIGLLLCPYFLFCGSYLYTDMIAIFFVIFGFYFYIHDRHFLSGACFVMAIASRQYMLAFPLAIAAYQLIIQLHNGFRIDRRWLIPLLAAATILGWIWFFGGLVPPEAATPGNLPIKQASQAALSITWLFPERSLYFLACVGFYFVLPEWLLFQRWKSPKIKLTLKHYVIASVLIILCLIFPPIDSKGVLTNIIRLLPINFLQVMTLYLLILGTCWRFARFNLTFWVLLMNFSILMRGFSWDKYAFPIVAVLWYLKSANALDNTPGSSGAQQRFSGLNLKGADNANRN